MELQQAIVKMEQGGSADGILQVVFQFCSKVLCLRYINDPMLLNFWVAACGACLGPS